MPSTSKSPSSAPRHLICHKFISGAQFKPYSDMPSTL
jgi:hypothetical protein